MDEDDTFETDLEEVEPELLPLDELDESVEGIDGYPEEEVGEDDDIDPLGGEDYLVSPEDSPE